MTLAEEIKAMLAKSRRYLASAELLSRNGDLDSAVSRPLLCNVLRRRGIAPHSRSDFLQPSGCISRVCTAICQGRLFPKEMHLWLYRAFEKRQISDYDYLAAIAEDEVAELQAKATEFLDRIAILLKAEGLI